MISRELLAWLTKKNKVLNRLYPLSSKREEIFARMTKLMEESGELAEQILAQYNLQRSDKKSSFNKTQLADEIADVLITTLLLADRLDINPSHALRNKIKKIDASLKNRTRRGEMSRASLVP